MVGPIIQLIQSAIYPLESVDHYTRISQNLEPGYHYARTKNPTVDVLHKRLAAMEGGERALVTASGMLAVFALVFHLARPGDEIVTSHMTYGEAYRLFFQLLPEHMGITARLVEDPGNLEDWERQITDKTRFVWAETPSNPTLSITDIMGLAEITKAQNIPLIVDNTQYELAKNQMPFGFGGLLSFVVKGGREGAVKTIESFKLIPIVPSFGTSRTIVTHPATHTHSYMIPEEREKAGIVDGLIRLSVGMEDPKDIIADLEQALNKL